MKKDEFITKMKKVENVMDSAIDGLNNLIKIDWQFIEIVERLKGDWAVWSLAGKDMYGNPYTAICHTFINNPEFENIEDIQKD